MKKGQPSVEAHRKFANTCHILGGVRDKGTKLFGGAKVKSEETGVIVFVSETKHLPGYQTCKCHPNCKIVKARQTMTGAPNLHRTRGILNLHTNLVPLQPIYVAQRTLAPVSDSGGGGGDVTYLA